MSSKIPLSNGSTSIDVTFPKYDWDFRVATPSNNILKDTINWIDASYNFGATSTVSDGAILDGTNDSIGLGIIDLSGSAQDYSYEMYFYVDSYTNADTLLNFCNSSTGSWNSSDGINWMINANSGDPYYRISDDYYHGDGRGTSGWQPLIMPVGSLVHAVMTVSNNSTGTGTAKFYQNNVVSSDRSWTRANGPYYNHNYICGGGTEYTGNELQMKLKYFRVYDYELSADQVSALYANASSISPFSFANLRINYGDVYLGQNSIKTLDDYKAENIPLHDISFGAFTVNRLKETYIQGPVDISGDLVVRSNKNTFYDISASKIGFSSGYDSVNPKIVTNDLSLNNRFFVGGDASFNGNVTIQGDLSLGSAISFTGTLANSKVNVGDTSIKTFTHDISLNAGLAIHGKTTVKNDLYLNAYTDVSANPVLSDGTYLKNMKMDKLNHRYIMDISRSAPFSTLTSNTLPSEIWDSSSNSGICVSADGKHIRTVNSGDLSNNATSYYSEDYGSSFHKDELLSQKFNYFDISINTASQYSSDFKFGSDKVFMSYNGQHQLVPRGISDIGTYDDYLYTSNDFGKNWNLRKSSTLRTFNYTVTANGSSNYIFNGETYTDAAQPTVNIAPNESVIFTIDTTTNGSHPFKIGTSSSGGEITDSTISSVTSGSNQVITFTPTSSGTFYYYCSAHGGMGNSITVANYNMGQFSPSTWFWNTGAVSADGKNMYVSGSNGFWKSSDYGRVWNQTSADSSFNFMSISADGKLVYGVNERKVYGSTDYGNTFSTLYTDSYTSDSSYCGISTSGNGKYLTIADGRSSDLYLSSDYGNSFTLHTPSESGTLSLNCGMSHSGKIILNSNYISYNYGNNFTYVPDLISNQLTNNDTFYSKANLEYILDPSNNALLQIPYKSAIFQDIYSVGSIKAGSTTYSSDYRLKENVQPLTENETVNELHPVKYYNTNLKKNDYGLLAHELQEKYPFLVSGEKDGAEKQSINYNGLISLLVHEVKNLKKEYQELVEMKNNA